MDRSDPYFYPATPDTIHSYASSIFGPIQKGECVTSVWVPMAGRRKWNKFIIENIDLFDKELPHCDKYIMVYVEPLDLTEESLQGYLHLMLKSFLEVAEKNKYVKKELISDLKNALKSNDYAYSHLLATLNVTMRKITDSGLEVLFFLGEFDELSFANKIFYNNLKSLWSKLYPRLHYHFLMVTIPDGDDFYYNWSELGELVLQNVLHVGLRTIAESNRLVEAYCKELGVSVSSEITDVIQEVCGGHPYSIRVAVRLYRDNNLSNKAEFEKFLIDSYEIRSISNSIFEKRTPIEKKVLQDVQMNKLIPNEQHKILNRLTDLGLVKDSNNQLVLFSKIFNLTVAKSNNINMTDVSTKKLNYDEKTGEIRYGQKTVEERFTRQEYSILALFLKNEGKVLSRDDIGEVLWGESNYEKYSDWAIDQLMSKLRKKLVQIGIDFKIATLRGRGYKLVS